MDDPLSRYRYSLPCQLSWLAKDDRSDSWLTVSSRRFVCRAGYEWGSTINSDIAYEKLRDLTVDWTHVQVYFGDERCLPDGDAQRNDRMAFDTLLKHVAIPPDNIHAIPAELGAREAAVRYAAVLADIKRLDLALLGMGEDGHTASLFPDNPATASAAPVVPVFGAPKLPAERVSLGMSTLNAARCKIFLITGAGKREVLAQIASGKLLPAARVAAAEWHLDRAALPA